MLMLEYDQQRSKATELELVQDFVIVAFRVDHEQIDALQLMPREQRLKSRSLRSFFYDQRLNFRNRRPMFQKHIAAERRQLVEPVGCLSRHGAQPVYRSIAIV